MEIKSLAKYVGIVFSCLLFTGQAFAYKALYDCGYPKRWPYDTFTINANPVGFAVNSKWRISFNKARNRFNQNPSDFYLNMRTDNDSVVGVANGESELWWSSSTAHSPAIAYTLTNCGTTYEADIVFYNGIAYEDVMDKINFWGFGGNQRPFETTAIHEIGHTAGLAHENREYNIMGTDYYFVHANGEQLRSYVGEDASDGLIWLYGSRNIEDVSLANFKYQGASGAYSQHEHTKLYDSNGNVLPGVNATSTCYRTCEVRYTVSPGQQIQFEVTAENNGRSSQTVQIAYYISTNSTISTADTLLTTESRTLYRGDPDTFKKTLTLPSNLNGSTNYWVGAVVDYTNSLAEVTEDNNATYTAIRTTAASTPVNVGDAFYISGAEDSLKNYVLDLSANDVASANAELVITLTGGSGDADLFVKYGSPASRGDADCESFNDNTSENCTLNVSNQPGQYYINVEGFSSYSNAYLDIDLNVVAVPNIYSGSSVTLSGAEDSKTYYKIDIASGQGNSNLVVTLNGGSGDADLFVKKGSLADRGDADCESYNDTTSETCNLNLDNNASTYYIMVEGYSAYSGATLSVNVQ